MAPSRVQNSNFALKEGADIFSPKNLVELGRPGTGVANEPGDLVLVPYSKYSFKDKKNNKLIYLAPLESTAKPLEIPLAKGGEAFWIDSRTLAHATSMPLTSSLRPTRCVLSAEPPTLIGSFPTTTATNFQYSAEISTLVFSDYVASFSLFTRTEPVFTKEQDEAWEARGTTAMVFDETYERHWDTWTGPKTPSHGKWTMGSEFSNLLKGTGHVEKTFRWTDDFSVDATLPLAWHTKQNVYLVSTTDPGNPKELTSGQQGATHSPVLNSDATKAAWTELAEDGYEADKANIVIYDIKWDRSADSLAFSSDGKLLYLTAGDHAKIKVYVLPIPPTPEASTTDPSGAASGIQTLPNGRLLFSRSSFTSPNDVYLIRDLKTFEDDIQASETTLEFKGKIEQVTRFTADALESKDLDQGEEFWFKGALERIKDDKKKWPIVLLIHVFAQQGYFTVMINPTGSTTFGQEFTDAIAQDWGGKPFVDLIAGWKYILDTYPQIDTDRAVAAGASWGGYAINWIQGHPEFGFNFKALICHDGVFDSNYNGYTTDELFFFNHEWGGRPWDEKSKKLSEEFSPANYVANWSTPQLLIHGSKDYRLPETESIGPFHALKQLGIPTRLVIFPDENHWVLNHGNSMKWHYEVFKWFDEFVGDGTA
ncbi:alpha/beta-hydrolase [Mycena leptocephala]|nr:alpha/beta-hydrolase [Mycena leptocephala]